MTHAADPETTMTITPAPATNVPSSAVRTGHVGRGEIAACFPLVARQRPACPPLRTRLDHVTAAARSAATAAAVGDRDAVVREAGRALTGAVRIARDCHHPDLAQTIAARHVGLYTDLTRPLTVQEAVQVVSAVTGMARVHLRTDPDRGVVMLTRILRALHGRVPIRVDGLSLPFGDIDTSLDQHRQLVGLVRTQLLVGGTTALATAGRWADAAALAATYTAEGDGRLLEGRQAQIIARLLDRDGNGARSLLAASAPASNHGTGVFREEDRDVAACLTALCATATTRGQALDAMVARYQADGVPGEGYASYRARYGATVAVIAHAHLHPAGPEIAAHAAAEALRSGDGYAAQEVLRHPAITETLTHHDRAVLDQVVKDAGLSGGVLNGRLLRRLGDVVDLAAHAVRPDS